MKQELGINLLVYKNALDQGVTQSSLLGKIKNQGINLAEVRREYIKDQNERECIRKEAEKWHMKLCYSVPEKLMIDQMPNQNLQVYMDEAMEMGVCNVKFNIGDLHKAKNDGMEELKHILNQYSMTVTIENDQTEENGTLSCVQAALQNIEKYKIPTGYTMDIGNWYWQKENPKEAFEQLKNQIQIFHLKNIDFVQENPETVLLEKGKIPWQKMVKQLKEKAMVFLEYPMEEKEISEQIETVKAIG